MKAVPQEAVLQAAVPRQEVGEQDHLHMKKCNLNSKCKGVDGTMETMETMETMRTPETMETTVVAIPTAGAKAVQVAEVAAAKAVRVQAVSHKPSTLM